MPHKPEAHDYIFEDAHGTVTANKHIDIITLEVGDSPTISSIATFSKCVLCHELNS